MDSSQIIVGVTFLIALAVAATMLISSIIELRNRRAAEPFEKPIFAAAVIDATIASLPLADAAATMNPDVFQAMDRWVVHSSNPWSLVDYVQDHHATIFAANAGFIDGLKGYVAESIVSDHFAALGHHVVLATTSNQPGWDLLIDNQPFQVKAGTTAVAAARHALERYPDIPVITDASAASHLEALDPHAITAVHEIAAQHLQSTTTQTLHGLDAIAHAGQVHVPFITIGVSSYFEIRLLMQGHTTFQRAITNVTIDAVGVAAGAAIGAKSGMAIGVIGHAPGMAIGAIIGTVAGAWAGKFGAKAVKAAAFNKLRQDYLIQVQLAGQSLRQEELRLGTAFASSIKKIDGSLQTERRHYSRVVKKASRNAVARRQRALHRLLRTIRCCKSSVPALKPAFKELPSIIDQDLTRGIDILVSLISDLRAQKNKNASLLEDRLRQFIESYRSANRVEHAAKAAYAEMLLRHDIKSRSEAALVLRNLASAAKRSYSKANELQVSLMKESRAIGKPIALTSS
jgi:hypothetical protein